jgi:NET1-associated nuclear protein 1 (U3 small nucleolar RNA-associated protein 17)
MGYDPQTSSLVLPSSHPSSIQIYNPITHTRSEIEISPSNRVSRRDPSSHGWDHDIARVTFVRVMERWMVSVDERVKKNEVTLKFWEREGRSNWTLNTRVDMPHGDGSLSDVRFRPLTPEDPSDTIATAGSDGYVRFWRTTKGSKGDGKLSLAAFSSMTNVLPFSQTERWHSVAPHEARSKAPSRIAFSRDGSLMAVGQGAFVTLHTFLAGRIGDVVQTVSCAEMKDILHLSFVGLKARYLVMGGLKDVVVWDVISSCGKNTSSSVDRAETVFQCNGDILPRP